jgi:two-component sensor histidine kinase
MIKDYPNAATSGLLKDRPPARWSTSRNLRMEILDLQKRLKASEEAAAVHAVMFREGDHRIKNSLQLVASLISLQARRETNVAVREALLAAASRVGSVASIHDALQESLGDGLIDIGLALRMTCASLRTMAGDPGHIDLAVDIESLRIPVAQAQPLILAVNELVVNALRHAFPERDRGLVQVSLSHDGGYLRITVADDGIGLPANYADGHGYGMSLVNIMMKQAGADLHAETRAGSRFTIQAPISPAFRAV